MGIRDYYNGKKRLEQTFRWYGPPDAVKLPLIAQAGAEGVVSALHHIPYGELWTLEEIERRKKEIEDAGLRWSVVESVPVHEDIKRWTGQYRKWLDNYKKTLENLGKAGIDTVCYNFMPVLDCTRTDHDYRLPDGSSALYFNRTEFIAFDVHILKRPGAAEEYNEEELESAHNWHEEASESDKSKVADSILLGMPGAADVYTLDKFQNVLDTYKGIGPDELRENLVAFIREVAPVAEEHGIMLTIHPDDPPYPLLGLPRVMSTFDDAKYLIDNAPSASNGLCFCTGSFGVRVDNDLPRMVRDLGSRIGFIHLRSTKRDEQGNFFEADHLAGDVDMYEVMRALLEEQQKRKKAIPMRPDHGHKMLDDPVKETYPGYSAIGRLRGLAELRGLEMGILRTM